MNCTSCHNPHHSVQTESPNFNDNAYHATTYAKKKKSKIRIVSCHMPSSSTIDIPHVNSRSQNRHSFETQPHEKGVCGLRGHQQQPPIKADQSKGLPYQYEKFDAQFLLDSANVLENMDLLTLSKGKFTCFISKKTIVESSMLVNPSRTYWKN